MRYTVSAADLKVSISRAKNNRLYDGIEAEIRKSRTSFQVYLVLCEACQAYTCNVCTPILRVGDQVPTFDVFWPKHLQEVRSTVNIHVQSM